VAQQATVTGEINLPRSGTSEIVGVTSLLWAGVEEMLRFTTVQHPHRTRTQRQSSDQGEQAR